MQDNLALHAKDMNALLEQQQAHLYVCGDAGMAKDVAILIEKIIKEQRGVEASVAEEIVKTMRSEGLYQEDAWS